MKRPETAQETFLYQHLHKAGDKPFRGTENKVIDPGQICCQFPENEKNHKDKNAQKVYFTFVLLMLKQEGFLRSFRSFHGAAPSR